MKAKDLKIIAVIVSIALFFTIVTSSAVSIAAVMYLIKDANATETVTSGEAGTGGSADSGSAGNSGGTANSGSSGGTANSGTSGDTANSGNSGDAANSGSSGGTANSGNTQDTTGGKSKAEILEIYTTVMNKAKTDKPGYTKIEYQTLPDGAENRVITEGETAVSALLDLAGNFMTTEETAKAEPDVNEKGSDMRWFPVYKQPKGCYLTDTSAIKEAKYEDLGNGKARVTIVLNEESNPEPMVEGSEAFMSNTGTMFSPLSRKDIDETLKGGVVSAVVKDIQYELIYHDCTAVVEYDTATNQIIKLDHYNHVTIKGSGTALVFIKVNIEKQELINTMNAYDFKY